MFWTQDQKYLTFYDKISYDIFTVSNHLHLHYPMSGSVPCWQSDWCIKIHDFKGSTKIVAIWCQKRNPHHGVPSGLSLRFFVSLMCSLLPKENILPVSPIQSAVQFRFDRVDLSNYIYLIWLLKTNVFQSFKKYFSFAIWIARHINQYMNWEILIMFYVINKCHYVLNRSRKCLLSND